MTYTFEILDDEVTIYKDGKELLHWVIDEWIENPSLVPDMIWAFLHPDQVVKSKYSNTHPKTQD